MKTRVIQFFLGAVLFAAVLECSSLCAFYILDRQAFSFSSVHAMQNETALEVPAKSEQALFDLPTVPHPYLGYVNNPDMWAPNPTHLGYSISTFGFFDKHPAVLHKKRKRIIIGVFGASVAWWVSSMGEAAFIDTLRQSPYFRQKDIQLVRVALSAYKQPQQLVALSYLLSLGAHFDYIVSLDGFNEVTLPAAGNIARSINPFFPYYWNEIFQNIGGEELKPEQIRIKLYQSWRRNWAAAFGSGRTRWTVTGNLVWRLTDRYLDGRIQTLRASLQQKRDPEARLPYAIRGPAFDVQGERNMYRSFARVWERSALTMERICTGMGIKYLHFLQPNQYVPGSKSLSEQERKQAYAPDIFWRQEVLKGYPELIKAGHRLLQAGVNYHDLTMLFQNNPDTLYVDNCCHLTLEGNAIVAKAIAEEVIAAARE